MRYETVIFDLDGTLVDSYDALHASINQTRATFGLSSLDVASVKSMVGDGLRVLLERAFQPIDVPETAQTVFEGYYDEVCCSASRILGGVEATIGRLDAAGARMAVCTNKPTSFSVKILDHLGLSKFFRAVVGPDVAGARKPDARHVWFTLAEAGGVAESALFVGDMTIDIEAARNAGIDVAAIASGAVSIDVLRDANADYYLERFSDLERIVMGDD